MMPIVLYALLPPLHGVEHAVVYSSETYYEDVDEDEDRVRKCTVELLIGADARAFRHSNIRFTISRKQGILDNIIHRVEIRSGTRPLPAISDEHVEMAIMIGRKYLQSYRPLNVSAIYPTITYEDDAAGRGGGRVTHVKTDIPTSIEKFSVETHADTVQFTVRRMQRGVYICNRTSHPGTPYDETALILMRRYAGEHMPKVEKIFLSLLSSELKRTPNESLWFIEGLGIDCLMESMDPLPPADILEERMTRLSVAAPEC